MTTELRLAITSAVCFVAFALLGIVVTHVQPSRLDIAGSVFRGASTPIALMFTRSGRALSIAALVLLSVAIYWRIEKPIWIPLGVGLSQLVSQGIIELLKRVFHRTRPDDWLVTHEFGYSYPSGHAATAVIFFGMWIVILALSPVPRFWKVLSIALLIVWMAGIDWSRLALAAHYVTDVVGGTLFGAAWVCLVLWLFSRLLLSRAFSV